jgi:hypothetical protein
MKRIALVVALIVLGATAAHAQTTYTPYRATADTAHYAHFYFAINNQVLALVLDAGDCQAAISYGLGDAYEVFYPSSCNTSLNGSIAYNSVAATPFTLDDGTKGTINASMWQAQKHCNQHGCWWTVVPGYVVSVTIQ